MISPYRRRWLIKDVIAGVVLTTVLVPQGKAYAELADCRRSRVCTRPSCAFSAMRVFGPSRILVLGPDSSLVPDDRGDDPVAIAANGDAKRAVALASVLALMVVAIMILVALAKLRFIADLVSKPTMVGCMNGLAPTILIGQLPKPLEFKVDADGLIREVTGFARRSGERRCGRGRDLVVGLKPEP